MSVEALTVLEAGGVIEFALPAHTSAATQPLDLSLFGPWKRNITNTLQRMNSVTFSNDYDFFDFCHVLRYAYEEAFTGENILSGFRSGLNAFNPSHLLGTLRPLSDTAAWTIVSVSEMESMLLEKREQLR